MSLYSATRTTTYRFQEVVQRRKVALECEECGKRITRTVKAFQTINPFNKNPDGTVKDRHDIHRELPDTLDKLELEVRKIVRLCRDCQEDADEQSI